MNGNFCNAKLSQPYQDTPVSCKFRGSGCFFEDLVVNLDDHETSCMFRSVRYRTPSCGYSRSVFRRFYSTVSSYRLPFCATSVTSSRISVLNQQAAYSFMFRKKLGKAKFIAVLRYLSYHLDKSTITGNFFIQTF
jgi:hypothetical protein